MIFGQLDELKFYKGISKNLDKAIEIIESGRYKTVPNGKEIIDGDAAFYSVVELETKKEKESFFEIHKNYLDIHVVIEGEEISGYCEKTSTTEKDLYNEETDLQFLNGEIGHRFNVGINNFVIYFPFEPHMPLIAKNDQTKKIKKAIFKVRV